MELGSTVRLIQTHITAVYRIYPDEVGRVKRVCRSSGQESETPPAGALRRHGHVILARRRRGQPRTRLPASLQHGEQGTGAHRPEHPYLACRSFMWIPGDIVLCLVRRAFSNDLPPPSISSTTSSTGIPLKPLTRAQLQDSTYLNRRVYRWLAAIGGWGPCEGDHDPCSPVDDTGLPPMVSTPAVRYSTSY